MIHIIWAFIMMASIAFSVINGTLSTMTTAIMDGAKEAVNLCILMAAVVGLWSGLMEIGVKSGIVGKLSDIMRPFLIWMFPGLDAGSREMKYIASNFAANLLGLGWAATPAGFGAMEEMNKSVKDNTASDEMCTFVLLNVSSLQLIPVTMIIYRSQYGSVSPAAIVIPGLIATGVSTITAIIFSKVMCKKSGYKKKREK